MIEYDVTPERSQYLQDEEVKIGVRIANHRAQSIQIPDLEMRASVQPVFHLTGPAWPKGVNFTANRILPQESVPPSEDQKLITIKGGGTWTGRFSLQPMLRPGPGEYELASNLQWDDVQAQSQPARFRVDPPHITSAHVGLGVRPNESAEGEVAFIQRGASSSQIYSFTFLEVRPAIAEAKIDAPLQRFTAGANATDIAVPWRKAPFFNEFLRWIVWREGRAIKALSSASEKPVSLELPTELDSIVRPPLKTTDGPVEVLAVSHDRAHLLLAEFSGRMGEEGSAKLAWNIPLPAHPLGITAALEADSSQSYRHIALIAEGSGGFEIFHARYRPGTTPQSFRSTHVAGRPLAGAQPALYIESNGRARVAVIAQPAGSAAVEIVEAVFEPNDSPAKVTIGPPSELPGAPVSGALLYTDRPDVPVRLEGVIEAAGNKLLKLDPALKLIPAPPCTPMSGILLAPGKQTTYTFCTGAERALYISAL